MAKPIEGVNIVDRVLERLAADRPELRLGRVRIEKIIPVSAGLGGGSADAAAVLRAVARTNGIADASAEFGAWATPLGADIPVCLGGCGRAAAVMMGVGDVIWRPLDDRALLPREVHAVLVNPDRPVSTATVFRALDADWLRCPPVPRMPKPTFCSFGDLIAWLVASRNDLERPARALVPVIGDVIDAISAQSGCRLARMSGSGATCFGLFETAAGAEHARVAITRAEPAWWARGTRLV